MSNFFIDEPKKHKSFELAGARPHYNPDRPGQVEHIFLDLALDIDQKICEGTCQIRLNPVRSGITQLALDAVNLNIQDVRIGRAKQPFDYDDERLVIHLKQETKVGKAITVAIAYSVNQPQRGLYFVGPEPNYPDKPTQVWTQGEDEDSRFWFPCFDYPGQLATSEIRVRVPKEFLAVSNGELVETSLEENQMIYHWLQKEIHPTYLMTLAVGEFAEIRDEWQGKPVLYYVEKGLEDSARLSMGKTPQMMAFLSEKYGVLYPYPKYAQVCVADFIFGGMENTSTTLLGDRYLLDERAAIDNRWTESLVVHELAHQWFGDLVVIKHWSHAWIKEGMASYSEVMWTEKEYGVDDAAYYRLNEARNYFNEDSNRYRRPVVTNIYRAAIELYDRHIYEKGACIYHMLRAELGEDLFWKAIHTFVQDNAHSTVETIDLLRAIDKATGRNLAFLFDQYVFRGGYPDYKVSYSWDTDSNLAKVTVKQTQADPKKPKHQELFDLKIPIAFGWVKTAGKKPPQVEQQTFTVRVHEAEQSFYLVLPSKPDFVSFDAGNHILKQVMLEYPVPELKTQLQHDPDPLSRINAAAALVKKGGLEAAQALGEALKKDTFWGVRIEVAQQLSKLQLDQALDLLKAGLKDEDARVRRAVVDAIATLKHGNSYKLLKPIAEKGDPSYLVEAAAIRGIGTLAGSGLANKPKEDKVIKLFKSVLKKRAGWNEVIRSGAISGLSQMKTSTDALDLVLEQTVSGTPQPLRLASIRALGAISAGQSPTDLQRILDSLKAISGESFFLTQVAVVSSLGQMETPKAIGILRGLANQTSDNRVERMAEEAIKKVQKKVGSGQAIQSVQEELEQLKKDNQTLKSRLEELEAKAKK
ncbi:Aminopeptidase N [Acaryochloris thomasi RCC1774]|uniref:Aminopeptidase N n=1 Tax=Acaryochloris thomasi RCC1774 TaxID=1764569 RepID=A0A2W1JLK3_9CYAN|nr:M1 family metallopeptidase [Acaryochloris thomasi]PZD74076.1 Aminopeptidase N [Acaryochloris thomasi RCC1774]